MVRCRKQHKGKEKVVRARGKPMHRARTAWCTALISPSKGPARKMRKKNPDRIPPPPPPPPACLQRLIHLAVGLQEPNGNSVHAFSHTLLNRLQCRLAQGLPPANVCPRGVCNLFLGCRAGSPPPPPLVDPHLGGQPPGSPGGVGGGGGAVGTPTYIPQNDAHDTLIILNIHNWGGKNSRKKLPINSGSHQPRFDPFLCFSSIFEFSTKF